MSVWEIIIGIVLIVFSLSIIGVVLLQEGRQANLGAISGRRGQLYGKGQGPHPGCQAGQVYQGHRDHLFRSGFHWYADYQVHLNATDG